MTDVIIAGIGQTAVGEHWGISIRELGFNAIEMALNDAGGLRPQAVYVANMLAPALSGQSHLATLITDFAGMRGIETATIEAGGASGGVALRQAYLAISSGLIDSVLVVGVEKMTEQPNEKLLSASATTLDSDYEADQGLTLTSQAAMLMKRYIYQFDVPEHAFAGFPVIAHKNGENNKFAMFQKAISREAYQKAGMVSEPLNMFDVSPFADGAAAILLTKSDLIPENFPHPQIRISASDVTTDTLALHDRKDPLELLAIKASVNSVLSQAAKSIKDIDLFEIYDVYSIYSALALEAFGVADKGRGWEWAKNGDLEIDGKLPISTFGGLKARGNPGGATGVYQAVEAVFQLRGAAGNNQVNNANLAMIQSFGGPAATVATHLLEKV